MRRTLAIFGITGGTGRALTLAAERRDWRVQGLVRPDRSVPDALRNARLVRGTFEDRDRLAEVVAGARGACCVLGPHPPFAEVFCAAATMAIVRAMGKAGCRRLICQTGALIGDGDRSWIFERMARAFVRRRPEVARDRIEQERVVEASHLDWTIVKPPRLTDGPATGAVEAGPALHVALMSRISRADLAEFIMDEIERPRFHRSRVFVKA